MPVGLEENGSVRRGVPELPKPGQKVYAADTGDLERIAGAGDLEVGRLSCDPSVPFTLSLNMLCSRHFAVLAMTGAGKSNAVAVTLASVLEKYPYSRVLVLDTHSEYVPLARKYQGVRVVSPIGRTAHLLEARYGLKPLPLEVPMWTLGFEEIAGLLRLDPSRATKQLMYLRDALQEVRQRRYERASADAIVYFEVEEKLVELAEELFAAVEEGRFSESYAKELRARVKSVIAG